MILSLARSVRNRSLAVGVLAWAVFGAASAAPAQCETKWLPGDGLPGIDGFPKDLVVWDPDGAGPRPPALVVAGSFAVAGNVACRNIALRDPVSGTWSALGTGTNGPIYSLAVMANGDLAVGGEFTEAGGLAVEHVARWNGSTWSALGTGLSAPSQGRVWALATLQNGDLVAGGVIATAGTNAVANIARWDGTAWSAMGTGMNDYVSSLCVLPNGNLVAGGYFTSAGSVSASKIARWNGTAWSAIGGGMSSSVGYHVSELLVAPNGDLYAAGQFLSAGTANVSNLARWNGVAWSAVGTGLNSNIVRALTFAPNGDLVAGGQFPFNNHISKWNGVAWSGLGSGMNGTVFALVTMPNGDVVAAGEFNIAGGVPVQGLARWNSAGWSALAPGNNLDVYALAALPNGELVAGGMFTHMGAVNANRIARWNGAGWAPLGAGVGGLVNAVAVLPNGDVVAGGEFTTAGGAPANRVARWNGATWSAMGTGMSSAVYTLTTLANGDLIAGGFFSVIGGSSGNGVVRWDGSAWLPLGAGVNGYVKSVLELPSGDLIVGGGFTTAGGVTANRVARWNGSTWSAMGAGLGNQVNALALLPNGDIVAGGVFVLGSGDAVTRVARWNGTAWLPHGVVTAEPLSLAVLPDGDVVAGFAGVGPTALPPGKIWRGNGTTWAPLGVGVNSSVAALTVMSNGDVVAGGSFTTAGGLASAYVARLTTICPATAIAEGAGCSGSGGANVLSALSLPWTGSTFRTVATGMPALSLALQLLGTGVAAIPLPAILPQGVPGCDLLVTPLTLVPSVPAAGSVTMAVPLPETMSLAGQVLYQQVVALDLDALGNLVAVTSSNRLAARIGTF